MTQQPKWRAADGDALVQKEEELSMTIADKQLVSNSDLDLAYPIYSSHEGILPKA